MKPTFSALLVLLSSGTLALAAPPTKKQVNSYSNLWSNSPFTTKPVQEGAGPVISAFDDWALGGVSPIEGGYMVVLTHKKNVGEKLVIEPRGTLKTSKDEMKWLQPGAAGTFKVERVEFGKDDWRKDTAVYLSSGGKTGPVKFDDKKLNPVAAAPAARQPGQPQQPGQPVVQPGQPNPQQPGGRPPRQRVLPPQPQTQQTPQTQRTR
jgi:hypothetical protein